MRTAGVYRRGKQYWIRYSVAGRQYREPAKTERKAEAEALLSKRKTEVFEGRFFPDRKTKDLTVGGLGDMWYEAQAAKKTIEDDRQRFVRIVQHLGEQTLVATIKADDIDRFKKAAGETLAEATVNRHLALLRAAFHLATKRGFRHRDPMAGVSFYREDNQRDRICSREEYAALLEAADPELRLAVVVAYHTAMRLGEIVNLRWEQVDLKRKILRLARGETKERAARIVPLADDVVRELKALPRAIDGNLFESIPNQLSVRFARLCRALQIKDLRFHDLRHTAITNLRRAGVDLVTIKAISGHRTWKVFERYNTVAEADLRKAVERTQGRK